MTSASPSYLQTLPNDQAGTFLDALQKVKDHLSNELQSLNQQVQQKTMQLQGIEALLAEAQAKESAQETTATSTPEATPSNLLAAPILPRVLADNSQERPSANCATASDDASTIEAVTVASATATTRKQTKSAKQPTAAKAKQATKAGISKGSIATKKKSTTQPKAKEKKTTTTKESELRALL